MHLPTFKHTSHIHTGLDIARHVTHVELWCSELLCRPLPEFFHESSRVLKHPFTYLTTPVPASQPASAAMTEKASKRSFANSKDCVLCDPEQLISPSWVLLFCILQDTSPPFLAAAGMRAFYHHRCVGMEVSGGTSAGIPHRVYQLSGQPTWLQRSPCPGVPLGKRVSILAFISGESCQA